MPRCKQQDIPGITYYKPDNQQQWPWKLRNKTSVEQDLWRTYILNKLLYKKELYLP